MHFTSSKHSIRLPYNVTHITNTISSIKETEHRSELKTTDCSTVFTLLCKFCKFKATEPDKMSARLRRECADLVASSRCDIFKKICCIGCFSYTEWKSTNVISLFKQGERSDWNNYHPISIIPAVAKVFERIGYNQFYENLTENNLIPCNQSGFRSFHPIHCYCFTRSHK